MTGRASILHFCDKFGVEGSMIHGLSQLFLWWFPLYDRDRFDVSLVGLRSPDPAGRYLEKHGLPITYLNTSKFSPATLPALLGIMRRLKPDLLHLHGYGAGNFGRLAARIAAPPRSSTSTSSIPASPSTSSSRRPCLSRSPRIRSRSPGP